MEDVESGGRKAGVAFDDGNRTVVLDNKVKIGEAEILLLIEKLAYL